MIIFLSPYSQFGNTFRRTVNSVHKLDEKFTGFRRKNKKQHGKTRAVFADNFILKDLRQRLHKPSKLLLP